jgi:DNA (cytosine-5)-methyltransferase 1
VKDVSRFDVVSAFAGGGGSSLGYRLAGGTIRLAIDNSDDALRTYSLNFPTTAVFHGDIADLSIANCCRLAGIERGELDILDGSPPCQGFSVIGKRRFADPRNQLVMEFVRLARGLQPRVLVMENVEGMVRGKMKLTFADCLRDMKRAGYAVKAWLLNTKYYGVPQDRKRILFIGVRKDLGIPPTYPQPQSEPQSVREALGLVGEGDLINYQFRKKSPCKRSIDLPCFTLSRPPPLLHFNGKERELTMEERSIISGFPHDWKWGNSANVLIGNAVPPPFARAVAEHIRDHILRVTR